MSEFFNSVKADLLDRRMLPLVAVVVVVLVAAIGYVVFGGGSSSTHARRGGLHRPRSPWRAWRPARRLTKRPSPRRPTAPPPSTAARPTTPSPRCPSRRPRRPHRAPARSPRPARLHRARPRSSGSSTKSSGESAPAPAPKPAAPSKPKTVYHVAVLFGVVPVGATPQTVQLTPYENLKLLTPLPSATAPLVVFRGVTRGWQERDLHARRRSDPARQRRMPAERLAVPGDRPAARPGRAARIPAAARPGRDLRTARREHRLQQGDRRRAGKRSCAASRRPGTRCSPATA